MESLEQLKKIADAFQPFSEEEWEIFAALWKPFSAKRKHQLLTPGETEKYLYFVVEGVQRIYYFDEQDREATIVFTYAPSFGGVLDSMMLKSPSKYYYETLSSSNFLRANFEELEKKSAKLPSLNLFYRKGLVSALSGLLERLAEVQCFSAEERFNSLLHRSPHILQLIPHKYIANYLGIDATNFSKLINQKAN